MQSSQLDPIQPTWCWTVVVSILFDHYIVVFILLDAIPFHLGFGYYFYRWNGKEEILLFVS